VCHNVYPTTFYFATDSKSGLSRPIYRLLKELAAKMALATERIRNKTLVQWGSTATRDAQFRNTTSDAN
jgi:hypothetical protein